MRGGLFSMCAAVLCLRWQSLGFFPGVLSLLLFNRVKNMFNQCHYSVLGMLKW